MVFSIIVIVLIGLVAYFHYLQGFFSAGLSAVLAVIAALVAFGYYETLVLTLLKGAFPENSVAVALTGLFAVTYLILRVAFDQMIPGNVRFPLLVDRIGAGVMGLVAGIAGTGVLVVAAQSMPFGYSIGGYSRYPVVEDMTIAIKIPGQYQIQDAVFSELERDKFVNDEASKLWVPVDEMILSLVSTASSDQGSLSRGNPFTRVHPNYLKELFGQRVGVQVGSRHAAWNQGDKKNVDVVGVYYSTQQLTQDDPEKWELEIEKEKHPLGIRHPKRSVPLEEDPQAKGKLRRPGPNKVFLVLRTSFTKEIADPKTAVISFAPATVRVNASGNNYFPIGVLAGGSVLQYQAPDDFLFVAPDKKVDLVFEIDESQLFAGGEPGAPRRIRDGTFFEFKRLARVDLSGREALSTIEPPALEEVELVRKEGAPLPGALAAAAGQGAPLLPQGPARLEDRIPQLINVATSQEDEPNGLQTWGTFSMQGRRLSKLQIDPTDPAGRIATGDNDVLVSHFVTPQGQQMVQLTIRPQGENRWAWADALPELTLVDESGKRHAPNGFFAKLQAADGRELLFVRYDGATKMRPVAAPTDARPTEVTLLFVIPRGTHFKTFDYKGTPVATVKV